MRSRKVISIALVLLSVFTNFMNLGGKADARGTTHYAIQTKQYVRPNSDTYVLLKSDVINTTIYEYCAKVPKDTILGYFTYDYDKCRNPSKENFSYNNGPVFKAYRDGIKIDITVIPASGKKTFEVYKTPRGKSQYTKAGYTQSFYCASELLSVEMGIPTMYSVYASGSNPNIMSGGGYIADWGPKKSSAGADGYNISIGVPFSLSTSVGTSSEYCKPVDLTNREKGLFKVQFDYIKWPSGNILHYCSPARRKVIFEKTYQACYCTWYDTDKAYTVYPYINYSISLSCSKISTDSHAKFSKQVCVNYNME